MENQGKARFSVFVEKCNRALQLARVLCWAGGRARRTALPKRQAHSVESCGAKK
jgi:hypothetical protein